MVRVGRPVVVQALPGYPPRAFGDVGLGGALGMHLEVAVGAVRKQLRTARPEVREPGDEFLRRSGGLLVKVEFGHVCPFVRDDSVSVAVRDATVAPVTTRGRSRVNMRDTEARLTDAFVAGAACQPAYQRFAHPWPCHPWSTPAASTALSSVRSALISSSLPHELSVGMQRMLRVRAACRASDLPGEVPGQAGRR